jgi:hypothetical protein
MSLKNKLVNKISFKNQVKIDRFSIELHSRFLYMIIYKLNLYIDVKNVHSLI